MSIMFHVIKAHRHTVVSTGLEKGYSPYRVFIQGLTALFCL